MASAARHVGVSLPTWKRAEGNLEPDIKKAIARVFGVEILIKPSGEVEYRYPEESKNNGSEQRETED